MDIERDILYKKIEEINKLQNKLNYYLEFENTNNFKIILKGKDKSNNIVYANGFFENKNAYMFLIGVLHGLTY